MLMTWQTSTVEASSTVTKTLEVILRIPVLLLLLLIEAIGATCTDDAVDDVEDDEIAFDEVDGDPLATT